MKSTLSLPSGRSVIYFHCLERKLDKVGKSPQLFQNGLPIGLIDWTDLIEIVAL